MRIIGGQYRGRKLLSPPHGETRPTSDRTRETIFNILMNNPHFGSRVLIDKTVLDVFAGTGALGLEALSRGAKSATFIEKNRETLSVLRTNLQAFGLPSSGIVGKDIRALPPNLQPPFDLVFVDPPYEGGLIPPTLSTLLAKKWIGDGSLLVLECAKTEQVQLSPPFSLILERMSGAAKLIFCVQGPLPSWQDEEKTILI
jgi:16S rRNA (guanine966-N2)-methyltransferase